MSKESIMDFTDYDDEALDQLRIDVLTEMERRAKVAALPGQIDALTRAYRQAVGLKDGTEYVSPTGWHDAIPPEDTRTFEGDLWKNTSGKPLSHSSTEYPDGWTLIEEGVDAVVPDPGEHEPWAEGVAYDFENDMAIATYGDDDNPLAVYTLITPHTSQLGWEPPKVPALWTRVG